MWGARAGDCIGDDGATKLAAGLEGNESASLQLQRNKIGNAGATAIARALEGSKVATLSLGLNQIGDKGATAIAVAMQRSNVTTLDLPFNQIRNEGATAIARALTQQSKVTTFSMGGNKIDVEGAKALLQVGAWKHLKSLDVSSNHLRFLPCEIGQLHQLRTLFFGYKAGLRSRERMPWMDVTDNPLESLPVELLNITGLEVRSDNPEAVVRMLAEVLKSNTSFTSFDLTLKLGDRVTNADEDRKLSTALQGEGLGFWFKKEQRILAFAVANATTHLDLRDNYLETLPMAVLRLTHLESIDVSGNQLRTLSPEVGKLQRLHTVRLDANRLEKLPIAEFLALPSLKLLSCKGNPRLYSPPPEIANQGGEAVVQYLRKASPQEGGIFNKDIGLILIGNEESGKTSMVNMVILSVLSIPCVSWSCPSPPPSCFALDCSVGHALTHTCTHIKHT